MAFQWTSPTPVGGGLNFTQAPALIRDDQWSWSDGWKPRDGMAEVGRTYQLIADGTWLPASHAIIGLVPDAFVPNSVLVGISHTSTKVVRLFNITSLGVVTEVSVSGAAPTGSGLLMMTAYLAGKQVLSFGRNTTSNYALAYYDGTNFFRIAPTMALDANFLTAASGYLLAGDIYDGASVSQQTVLVSDANSVTTWDPDVSNAADAFEVWGPQPIRGLTAWGPGALIGTGDRIFAATATGGIPPFTVREVETRGIANATSQHLVATPYGAFYLSADDLYPLGGAGVGRAVFAHLRSANLALIPKLLWHPSFGTLVLHVNQVSPAGGVTWFYNPSEQVWWRRTVANPPSAHEITWPLIASVDAFHWLIDTTGRVWVDKPSGSLVAQSGAFFDTKDFAFGSPGETDEVAAIKVDWEPLSNATTDAIDVLGYAHNDLSRSVLGAEGAETNFTASFTSFGTLTAGQTELPVRMKGKYHRFRIRQNSGFVRVRSLSLYRQKAGDKVRSA